MTNVVYTEKARPIVTFITQEGSYPTVSRSSASDFPVQGYSGINTDLLSFQIQNDMSQDLPSAVVTLSDSFNWAIIKPNDYVSIDIMYTSNIFNGDTQYGNNSTCLFTGLVSNVSESFNGSENSRIFTITIQGLAKILNNVKLSTFDEAQQHSAYALLPNDEKKGIKFTGKSSAGIIYSILKKFILFDAIDNTSVNKITMDKRNYDSNTGNSNNNNNSDNDIETGQRITNLLYDFTNANGNELGVKDLIYVDITENKDETYSIADGDSKNNITKYSNYNGSILNMIKDVSGQPFDELFWTHENGKATLTYRPTPFDPENWLKLPLIEVGTDAIISNNFSVTDSDQSSVFKLTAEEQAASEHMENYLYPDTNINLIRKYGYTTLAVANDYFSSQGQKHENTKGVSGNSEANKGMNQAMQNQRPPYSQIQFIASAITKKKKSDTVFIPPEYGGNDTYDVVKGLLSSCKTKSDFINQCTAVNPTLFGSGKAELLWNDFHNSSMSSKSETTITVRRYLQDIMPTYVPISEKSIGNMTNLKSTAYIKKHPKYAAQDLMYLLDYKIGSKQAYEICKIIGQNGNITEQEYNEIMTKYSYSDTEDGVGATAGDESADKVPQLMQTYARKLFNWYADNTKFYSGTITINGTKGIEVGKRLGVHSAKDGLYYEFYIESVSHTFSFQNGWTTQVGVTRGRAMDSLSDDSVTKYRFTPPYSFWGQFEVFTGGYFGEQSTKDAIKDAVSKESTSGTSDSNSGNPSGKSTKCNGKNGQVVDYWGYESVPEDVKKAIDTNCILSENDIKNDTTFYGTGLQGQCTHYSHAYVKTKKPGKELANAGNGGDVAQAYISAGTAKKVDKPTVGAIFSAKDGHLWAKGSAGHTGVVCGCYDDGSFLCVQLNVPPHKATSIQPNITKIDGVSENASWVTFAELK